MIGLLEDYTALIIQAILAIWIGSRRSLTSQVVERLSSKDAWQFPFIGSGVLVGIFIVVKYVRKDLLDALVAIYFASIGAVCLAQVIRPIIKKFIPTVQRFSLFGDRLSFDFVDVVSFTIGISVGVVWAITKNWVASNILGFGFAVEAITIINIGSFNVGAILLCGLFVYDVFWVFGTDVMVSVVKGFNAPIKLMYPRSGIVTPLLMGNEIGIERSVLGLGDIAIPGFFISLLLRFDEKYYPGFKQPTFFLCGIASYLAGLINTMAVMHFMKAAQPALLYLVPWLLLTSLVVGVFTGKLKELLEFVSEKEKTTTTDEKQKLN